MDELRKELSEYLNKNSCTIEDCANKLNIELTKLQQIQSNDGVLTSDEITRIMSKLKPSMRNGKKAVRILDLLFRFGATIMGLVVLLLCINGYSETQTLIALLSIGLVCSSFTILPKIEK